MRTLIAANWKMFKTRAEAQQTASELVSLLHSDWPAERDIVLFAPFTALAETARAVADSPVAVGAQDVYPAHQGAFTGEISPDMILDCGASWVLAGHSERRHILGESADFVGKKTAFALEAGLSVMLCIGETLEEREEDKLEAVLRAQLEQAVRGLSAEVCLKKLAIAYEPVWAIGTGKVASEKDILEAHAMVRNILGVILGSTAGSLPILYGGSVKPENASAILALDNVNGLLVGGASLRAESFSKIIRA